MVCACINQYNYIVEFPDCNTIIYKDLSSWVEVPPTYTIVITYPGGTLTWVIETGVSNYMEGTFPSGVYCIEFVDCNGDIIKSQFLNTCLLECAIKEKIASILLCDDDTKWKQIETAKKYIEIAHAKFECEWCDISEVTKFLDLAKKELNDCTCSKAK